MYESYGGTYEGGNQDDLYVSDPSGASWNEFKI